MNATTGAVTKAPTFGKAPWLGSSPTGVNFTLYYETDKFNARVSTSYRDEYYTTYPLAAGNCDPGLQPNGTACDSPLINEFSGAKSTMNVDFSMRYQPLDQVSITFEALNITNEMAERFAYNDPAISSYGGAGPNYRIGIRYKY